MGAENGVFSRAGIGNVGSYQVAGYPFITGSTLAGAGAEQRVVFPLITKKVTVTSRGAGEINIHFAPLAAPGNVISGNHFLELTGSGNTVEINCKCKEIYISSPGAATEFDLFAELTTIGTEEMPILTGSGITE
jgi:hypothetical protein